MESTLSYSTFGSIGLCIAFILIIKFVKTMDDISVGIFTALAMNVFSIFWSGIIALFGDSSKEYEVLMDEIAKDIVLFLDGNEEHKKQGEQLIIDIRDCKCRYEDNPPYWKFSSSINQLKYINTLIEKEIGRAHV